MRRRLGALVGEVRSGLKEYWPDYASFLESDEAGIVEAAAVFLDRLITMSDVGPASLERGRHPGDETINLVFEKIGRERMQAGDDLNRLLTAFQFGARLAWRQVSAAALEIGLPTASVAALADAVFVFVNQLTFATARGYLKEQIEDGRERERRREALAQLLLSDRASAQTVQVAAARAAWPVPKTATVVLVDSEDETVRAVLARLDPRCLPVRHDGIYGAIVPDATGPARRRWLAQQLAGAEAVVGYDVPLAFVPRSAEVAGIALRLRHSGVLRGDPVFADEHLDTIIVSRDAGLLQAHRRQMLAPLDDLSPGQQARLTETLSSWLLHFGDRQAVATELRIHPQTVRYRLAQLRELFGADLDSPRSRARLFLALAWSQS